MITKIRELDPYQVLFPIGIAHAVLGAALWILFAANRTAYPGLDHAHYMIIGFLFSFASGFMLTAVPRFTGTDRCSPPELFVATLLALTSFIAPRSIVALAMLLFLVTFFVRRIAKRTFSPPPHFIFLPIGLLIGICGSAMVAFVEAGLIDTRYASTGRLFLYYGTMLFIVLGIGTKLIAALLGWEAPPNHTIKPLNTFKKTSQLELALPVIAAAILLSGFLVEALGYAMPGRTLRAVCATGIAIQKWKLYRLPKQSGKLAFWLWVSALCLLIGLWVHALAPGLGVHAAHLIFMGGFGIMTLMVASRVTLAHGGYALEIESESKVFAASAFLILAATLTRFVAPRMSTYANHLGYAAFCWIAGILVWGTYFVPKILFHAGKKP